MDNRFKIKEGVVTALVAIALISTLITTAAVFNSEAGASEKVFAGITVVSVICGIGALIHENNKPK